jgi:hypothetical protein
LLAQYSGRSAVVAAMAISNHVVILDSKTAMIDTSLGTDAWVRILTDMVDQEDRIHSLRWRRDEQDGAYWARPARMGEQERHRFAPSSIPSDHLATTNLQLQVRFPTGRDIDQPQATRRLLEVLHKSTKQQWQVGQQTPPRKHEVWAEPNMDTGLWSGNMVLQFDDATTLHHMIKIFDSIAIRDALGTHRLLVSIPRATPSGNGKGGGPGRPRIP